MRALWTLSDGACEATDGGAVMPAPLLAMALYAAALEMGGGACEA